MPPKRGKASARATSPRPKVRAAKGYRHPDPIPRGEILTDLQKRKWTLGGSIGIGGFGEIYSASEASKNKEDVVVKIEPYENGPLFVETHFYLRAGKEETIKNWMASKRLKFLGMPRWYGNGIHTYKNTKYRFLVMQRFGTDIQKKLEGCGGRFSPKAVLTLGMKIIDVLEYLHSIGYVHNDIKAGNLLLGADNSNQVYLVDYGICCRYVTSEGKVKEHRKDPKSAHDGTLLYTSRDAHDGASFSRRGDLEILGYNMIHWLTGTLSWEDVKDPASVMDQKQKLMKNPAQVGHQKQLPEELIQYFVYVSKLKFTEEPDYGHCKQLLALALKRLKLPNDGHLMLDEKPAKGTPASRKGRKLMPQSEDSEDDVEPKKVRRSPRKAKASNNKSANSKSQSLPQQNSLAFDNPTPAMKSMIAQLQKQQEDKVTKASAKRRPRKNQIAKESGASQNGTSLTASAENSPELF